MKPKVNSKDHSITFFFESDFESEAVWDILTGHDCNIKLVVGLVSNALTISREVPTLINNNTKNNKLDVSAEMKKQGKLFSQMFKDARNKQKI